MTYRRLVLLPEDALDSPLDGYGSNLKVCHRVMKTLGECSGRQGGTATRWQLYTRRSSYPQCGEDTLHQNWVPVPTTRSTIYVPLPHAAKPSTDKIP